LRSFRPDDHDAYHILAPTLIECNDAKAFQELRKEMVVHFTGTTNVFAADRMAKDGLTLPPGESELRPLSEMADFAVSAGRSYAAYSLFEVCKALAEYRQEHFGAASQWAEKASANDFPYSKAEAFAIMAMAQFKVGRTDDARAALASAVKVARESMPQLESGDLGGEWRDWIISHALLKEAADLLNASPLSDSRAISK
jgi:hypothetical protein